MHILSVKDPAFRKYGRVITNVDFTQLVEEMKKTTKRIYEAVKKIPKGCVATYGQVAAMAGEPKMARAVGNALHKNPDPDHIPCYRVVNSKGELSGAFAFGGSNEQANRLRADGIEVTGNKVDLQKFGISL